MYVVVVALTMLLFFAFVLAGWKAIASQRVAAEVYRQRKNRRDSGRVAKDVEVILREHWTGKVVDLDLFRTMWCELSVAVDIDPRLLRPDDQVRQLIITTPSKGPDTSLELLDFFGRHLPECDPETVLASVAGEEGETIADIITYVVEFQSRHPSRFR